MSLQQGQFTRTLREQQTLQQQPRQPVRYEAPGQLNWVSGLGAFMALGCIINIVVTLTPAFPFADSERPTVLLINGLIAVIGVVLIYLSLRSQAEN